MNYPMFDSNPGRAISEAATLDDATAFCTNCDEYATIEVTRHGRAALAIDALKRWHEDAHPGTFAWCVERPCHDVATILMRGDLL